MVLQGQVAGTGGCVDRENVVLCVCGGGGSPGRGVEGGRGVRKRGRVCLDTEEQRVCAASIRCWRGSHGGASRTSGGHWWVGGWVGCQPGGGVQWVMGGREIGWVGGVCCKDKWEALVGGGRGVHGGEERRTTGIGGCVKLWWWWCVCVCGGGFPIGTGHKALLTILLRSLLLLLLLLLQVLPEEKRYVMKCSAGCVMMWHGHERCWKEFEKGYEQESRDNTTGHGINLVQVRLPLGVCWVASRGSTVCQPWKCTQETQASM